jgi:hypothetical protein
MEMEFWQHALRLSSQIGETLPADPDLREL